MFDAVTGHVAAILTEIFGMRPGATGDGVLLVYDEACALSRLLSDAYRRVLPDAKIIRFDEADTSPISLAFDALKPGDLVILVQSSSFRLDAFRIRVHLFERGLKVIEHPHLQRVREDEIGTYVAALAHDAPYYRRVGRGLKDRLDKATEVWLVGGGHSLVYGGAFEVSKLNIGDYTGMKNVGGQFPIGEVFSELADLTQLNGRIGLFAFGDRTFSVASCETPIVITVKDGRLTGTEGSSPEFEAVLQDIRDHEGEIWVRELGFGLNRALTRTARIAHDVGIYERMCGVHLSLGSKHALYPKAGFHKKKVKFHVDVFADVDAVTIDGVAVYEDGSYRF